MNIHRFKFKTLFSIKFIFSQQKGMYRSVHHLNNKLDDFLPKEDTKLSQIDTGIKVTSLENYSPLTQVAVAIKAGSRYEDPKLNLGITHCLRNAAILSTKNLTSFKLTRNLELCGAKLSVTGTRDHLFYILKCSRDDVDSGMEILSEITNKQVFKPWELSDCVSTMYSDVAFLNQNPFAVLNELLHKAAFRGGLSNSIYSPSYMIGKHSCEMLHDFVQDNFTSSRLSVVAIGMSHNHLQTCVNDLFNMNDPVADSGLDVVKFAAGEVRQEADIEKVHVAIAAEGASINTKESLCLSILEQILGTGSSIKHCGSTFTKLGAAAASCTLNPFYVSCLNINYSDSGLFGVHIVGLPDDMNKLIKAVLTEMKMVTKNITETSLEIAKQKLKEKLLIEKENTTNVLTTMAIETSETGQIRDTDELLKAVDALKVSDIQTIAGRVMKAKPAMAALGRLYSTPHVDELM